MVVGGSTEMFPRLPTCVRGSQGSNEQVRHQPLSAVWKAQQEFGNYTQKVRIIVQFVAVHRVAILHCSAGNV